MKSALEVLLLALVVVTFITPLVRKLAFHFGAVSHPGGRHIHERAIPRLGGIAIAIAFLVPLALVTFTNDLIAELFHKESRRVIGLASGAVAMCLVGSIDDTRGLRPIYKLGAQIAVALLAFLCGYAVHVVYVPFFGNLEMGIFALPVTMLWIVGVINAVNLIDGLDGLAAGVVFFAAVTNFAVSFLNGNLFVALLSAAVAGAVFGFLFYNFNPARIFMGDSGSYFLGYVLAVSSLLSNKSSTAVSLLVPVVALGVPIFDTLFAMVRRILERRSIFSPDRGHLHHRLLDMGITHRRAVLLIYGICILFTVAAIAISLGRSWQVGAALLGASAVLIGLIRFVGYFELSLLRNRQKARLRSRDSEMMRYALPRVPVMFDEAKSVDELLEALAHFAREADLGVVEIEKIASERRNNPEPTFRWTREPAQPTRDMIWATFPIGRDDIARSTIRFGWLNDYGEVSPQSEILLQIVTDVLDKNLYRLKSSLSSLPSTPESIEVALPLSAEQALSRRTG